MKSRNLEHKSVAQELDIVLILQSLALARTYNRKHSMAEVLLLVLWGQDHPQGNSNTNNELEAEMLLTCP